MKKPQTLIIGLEGVTFNLLHPLIRSGCLPHLSKIMSEGVWGPLEAWPNLNSASSWSSIVTGVNPGQHGIFNLSDAHAQTGQPFRFRTASERKKDPFWRVLSEAGQSVGVVNVPISYPADRLHGFMIAGNDSPSIHSHGFVFPPDLLDELQRQGIDYIIDVPTRDVLKQREAHQCPSKVQQMVDVQARAILHLMKNHPWDVLMAVITAPEKVQHFFYPDSNQPIQSEDWRPVRQLYEQMDAFLGKALSFINNHTTLLILSNHGFGRAYSHPNFLNSLFFQLGLLSYRHDQGNLKARWLKKLLFYGRRFIPQNLQKPFALAFPLFYQSVLRERLYSNVEWLKTKVFAPPYGRRVYINLQGRQSKGIVPLKDYESLCEQVRQILLDLTDSVTGKSLIHEVNRYDNLYHGPYKDRDADLFIRWNQDLKYDSVSLTRGRNSITIPNPKPKGIRRWLTGSHRSEGILIAYGKGIKRESPVTGAHIYDIVPTLYYLQNVPIPPDLDGKVLIEIFTEERLRQHLINNSNPK